MFKNYFLIAWRNLVRNKIFSTIKIFGLSIGLTVCMLIFLYTKDELSYDQFQQHKTQIYRITQKWQMGNNPTQEMGVTNGILADVFGKQVPEVQQTVRVNGATVTVKKGNEVINEGPFFVDDNFFSVFTFPLLEGNPDLALKDIHSVVLTKDIAKKYFGNEDPVGKTMQIKMDSAFESFTVTGLAADPPVNSTMKTHMLLPYKYYEKYNTNTSWIGGSINTFVELKAKSDVPRTLKKMQSIFDKNTHSDLVKAAKEQGTSFKIMLMLQPLTNIHFGKGGEVSNGLADGSSATYSYILTCIAIFILIIACINFINLAVAQSLKRSKEIGIRKVVGSTRSQLVKQFMAESFLVSFVAFIIAIALTSLTLPFFNELADKKLSFSYLSDGYLYAGYFLLLMMTAFISGFYPSLVLSNFQPVEVLYSRQKLMGKNYLTRGLIVLQFALAIFLIIGTIAINSQLNFLTHTDLGYNSKNLVHIDLPYSKSNTQLVGFLKNELIKDPQVMVVAPRNGGRNIFEVKTNEKRLQVENNRIDENYFPELSIPLIAGRNFSPQYHTDSLNKIIVNEQFVKESGWKLNESIGKSVRVPELDNKEEIIIGVVRNYHFSSLREKITPAMYSMDQQFDYGELWVKIGSANIPHTLAFLQSSFKKIVPYFPYSYDFMDTINERNYESEARWKKIISIASGLFIFISCIGLLGLVILSIEQRTKEIGIRKVLGAAALRIVVLISKEFMLLISIAILIAIPAGYYFIHNWLEAFAYRISISWWIFGIAGISVLLIAFVTISIQSMRAALANPIRSLRNE